MSQVFRFPGGIHPDAHKAASTGLPVAVAPVPPLLVVPLQQHLGMRTRPVVAPGDRVLKGQVVGGCEGAVSAAVHAPTSGRVLAIEPRPVPHPSGLPDLCVVIEADGEDRWGERTPCDPAALPPDELARVLCTAGVVGLGGAVFPAHAKAAAGRSHTIRTLIVNGAECEPWITCDDMLMRSRASEVVSGIDILRGIVQPGAVVIGIEDNKPDAIDAMKDAVAAAGLPFEVVAVPTVYPGGGEKQLARVLTGIEIPSGHRPFDAGILCFNVGTARAVHRAVRLGEPLVSRFVTVTGNVATPRNYEVLIGTPVADLVALAGPRADTEGLVMGGPMMGFDLPSDRVPVVKAMNCVIARSRALFPPPPPALPCIRCGRCADACPASLQPMDLYWVSRAKNFDKARKLSVADCIECGCCDYVCPSHIPLAGYFRFAKGEIATQDRDQVAADEARMRHEFRQFRLEREKQERLAKLAEKTGKRPAGASAGDADPKRAAIEAALQKAKAKQAQAAAAEASSAEPAQSE